MSDVQLIIEDGDLADEVLLVEEAVTIESLAAIFATDPDTLKDALEIDPDAGFDAAALVTVTDAADAVVSPTDTDRLPWIQTVSAAGVLRKMTWAGLKGFLKTYFDTIYTTTSAVATQISNAITALNLGNAATKNVGTTAGTVAAGDDSRLSDSRTPTAHKSSHATGGSDAIAPSDIGAATTAQGTAADLAKAKTDLITVTSPINLDTLGSGAPTNLLTGITPTVQSGWTDSGGGVYVANIASGFAAIFWDNVSIEDGALYLLRFYCSARTSGTLGTALGTQGSTLANPLNIQVWNTDALSWSGFFHMKHTPSQPDTLTIRANNGFVGTIQSVSLVKVAALTA